MPEVLPAPHTAPTRAGTGTGRVGSAPKGSLSRRHLAAPRSPATRSHATVHIAARSPLPMRYRIILFDFDGTLADSFPLFLRAYGEIADRHGFARLAPEDLEMLRGLSPRQMIQHVGMPMWKLPFVAADFIAYMRSHLDEVRLFEGVESLLRDLDEAGLRIAVVSSNAEDNLRALIGPATLPHIHHIESGMSMFGKARRIRQALQQSGFDAGAALYVGDQISDQEGAREAGVDFGAVSWGYGCPDSLRAAQPERFFERIDDLRRLLTPI